MKANFMETTLAAVQQAISWKGIRAVIGATVVLKENIVAFCVLFTFHIMDNKFCGDCPPLQ